MRDCPQQPPTVTRLADFATAQILSYLKTTNLKKALLLNFLAERMVDGIKRFTVGLSYLPEITELSQA